MGKNYRETSHLEEDAREGLLFQTWTGDWGLKIKPWYEMDKIIFAFIDKGASGKGNSFNVCVPVSLDCAACFENWAADILGYIPGHPNIRALRSMWKVLADESAAGEKYPKNYKATTGENGEKSVGICNSTKGGYCINASSAIDGKKVFANIPVSAYDLLRIAIRFEETYATRREEILDIRMKGIVEASSFSGNQNTEDAGSSIPPQGNPVKKGSPEAEEEIVLKMISVASIVEDEDGTKVFGARLVKEDGQKGETNYVVAIPEDTRIPEAKLEKFREMTEKADVKFTFRGKDCRKKDGRLYWMSLE